MHNGFEELIKAFRGEILSKEFIINGRKIVLRTLKGSEREEAMQKAVLLALSSQYQEAFLRRPVMGFALVSIDGMALASHPEILSKLNDKDRPLKLNEAVELLYNEFDSNLQDALYSKFLELDSERLKGIEEVKK